MKITYYLCKNASDHMHLFGGGIEMVLEGRNNKYMRGGKGGKPDKQMVEI